MHGWRQTGAQTERIKQNQVQLTPFTTVDIPLTVRELKQLRHATPGGCVWCLPPLSFLSKRVALWLKGFKTVCFHSLPLSRFQSLLNWSARIAARLFGGKVPRIKYQVGDRDEQTGQRREEMEMLCLEWSFRAARCRCGDVTSSAHPLGLTMILSCLEDSRGSGRYPTGWLTHPDWAVIRQKQQGFHPGDDARLS